MTYSLDSLQLGIIKKERVSTDAQLFDQPLPRQSAKETFLMDLFGVVKIITLDGAFIAGTGGLTIKEFIDQFIDDSSGVIRGNQTFKSYTSSTFSTSINVIVKNFDYSYEEADVSKVNYTLALQEGSVI